MRTDEMQGQGSDDQMSQIESEFNTNQQKVVEMLIDNCMNVDTSIPRVVCGKFE